MNAKPREEFQRLERIRARLARASFRLEMAEPERICAIVSAHREGLSIREIARQVGLGPTRVHRLVTSPQTDCVEHGLSELRDAGWPAPEDSLPGAEEQVADRLTEEAATLFSCLGWMESLAAGESTVLNFRPVDDWPQACYFVVNQSRVIRVLKRIVHDFEELARARRLVAFPPARTAPTRACGCVAAWLNPPIEISLRGASIRQSHQASEDYELRMQRAGLPAPLNPYRYLNRSGK